MIRRLLFALSLSITVAAAAAESVDPNNARGFQAEKVYDFFGLDTVNPLNGNLNVRIPIGQAYTLRPGFSYQFMLTYNSKVWDYEADDATKNRNAIRERYSNSGLGWLLSLGRVQKPAVNISGTYVYIAPDGAQHDMDNPEPNGISYSRDSSYLRMTITPAGALPQNVTGIKIESADGVVMTFDGSGELLEMRDRFDNWVKSSVAGLVWTITDGHGNLPAARTHTITFENAPVAYTPANLKKRIKTVSLAAFPKESGATAVYTFTYDDTTVDNGGCGTPPNGTWQPPAQYDVPLLTRVDLPEGAYRMAYRTTNGTVACSSGIMNELFLPTQGSIAWEHGAYSLSRSYCIDDTLDVDRGIWTDTYSGVTLRQLKDHSGTAREQTVYEPVIRSEGTGHFTCGKKNYFNRELPPKVAVTSVTAAGTTVENYFSALRVTGWYETASDPKVSEYGLPFTRTEPSAGTAPDQVYLSTRTYRGSSLLRSTYAAYEYDGGTTVPGRDTRMVRSRTVYHDDTGDAPDRLCKDGQATKPCWSQTSKSDYAGFGHYRTEQTTSNFPEAVTRTSYRNYDPAGLWSAAAGAVWLFGDYTTTRITEGTATRETTTAFDPGKGVITSVLTGPAANGLLSATCRDARGYVTSERWLGGASGSAPSNPCAHARRAGEFVLDHAYVFGPTTISHKASWDGNTALGMEDTTPLEDEVVDEILDTNTHLPLTTRDGADLTTTYAFDRMSRLTSIQPPGLAATTYTYSNAAVQTTSAGKKLTPASVRMSTTSATSQKGSIQRQYQYDSFGRLWREKSLMPDESWSVRETLYDGDGRRASVSETVTLVIPQTPGATEFDFSPAQKTTFTNHDAFGRARTVTTADGKATTFAFRGARISSRSVTVAGLADAVTTVEEMDALGRLISVTENAGGTPEIRTKYRYDPNGNLTEVDMAGQIRRFVYDVRNLLTSETHPESGTTTYGDFDARGQARRRQIGAFIDVTMVYDDAGRLTDLSRTGGGPIKQYRFDAGNGRLSFTARHNELPHLGVVAVTESIHYDDGGRPESRYQTVSDGAGLTGRQFVHAVSYDDLGLLQSILYPRRTDLSDPSRPTVTYTHRNGGLTGVDGWATLTYQANGLITKVLHNGNVKETWAADPDGMARPSKITVCRDTTNDNECAPSAQQLWTSGGYAFDGTGNIASIGPARYQYDAFSRLTNWITPESTGAVTYDVYGNRISTHLQQCAPSASGFFSCSVTATLDHAVVAKTNRYQTTSYDVAGNVIADRGRTFTYDAVSMPNSATVSGRTFLYVYNVDDERIAAVERLADGSTKTTWTIRGFANQLLSVWTDDTWNEDQIWRGSALVGQRNSAGKRHYSLDHLGSPRVITSDTGTLIGTQSFDPFGSGGAKDSGALQFTGHERDKANLGDGNADLPDYAHARLLDVESGRFLSVDPVLNKGALRKPQLWNRYSYVSNNPLGFVDPDGRLLQLSGCAKDLNSAGCKTEAALFLSTFGKQSAAAGKHLQVGRNGIVTFKGITGAAFAAKFGMMGKASAMLISNRAATFSISANPADVRAGSGGASRDGNAVAVDMSQFPQRMGGITQTSTGALAHEIGHLIGSMVPGIEDAFNSRLARALSTQNEGYATAFENQWRREHGQPQRLFYKYFYGDVQHTRDDVFEWPTP